ncbi:hypothetical protein GCM10010176_107170 [Nonomuraea spiralis]|nr:hypothetical protein GCM10010176_107170 [Nonomuraea spiralis]
MEETVALLRARAPKLDRALRKTVRDGLHYLVLDGMLIPTDRVRADRPYYSAKRRAEALAGLGVGRGGPPFLTSRSRGCLRWSRRGISHNVAMIGGCVKTRAFWRLPRASARLVFPAVHAAEQSQDLVGEVPSRFRTVSHIS